MHSPGDTDRPDPFELGQNAEGGQSQPPVPDGGGADGAIVGGGFYVIGLADPVAVQNVGPGEGADSGDGRVGLAEEEIGVNEPVVAGGLFLQFEKAGGIQPGEGPTHGAVAGGGGGEDQVPETVAPLDGLFIVGVEHGPDHQHGEAQLVRGLAVKPVVDLIKLAGMAEG